MATLLHLTGRAVTDANGAPYPAAVAHFYIVGTTTDQDTYTTAALSVENDNPVVSDASTGIFPAIYLAAKRYKVVIKDASGNTRQTWEVVDDAEHVIYSESEPSPTFPRLKWVKISTNILSERNSANDAWINRGDADSGVNAASVTEVLAGTSTSKAVTPDALAGLWQRGGNLTPDTGAISLPSGGGGVYNVAAGNVSSISTAVGGRKVVFVIGGAGTWTHNGTSLILPGAANLTLEAGDIIEFTNEAATDGSGTNWRCTGLLTNEGRLIPASIATQAQMEAASSVEVAVSPGRQHFHPRHPKARAMVTVSGGTPTLQESAGVDSIADTATGRLTVNLEPDLSTVYYTVHVTPERNQTTLADVGDIYTHGIRNATVAVGSVQLEQTDCSASPNLVDPASWHMTVLGDYA